MPGNPLLVRSLVSVLTAAGGRPAEAGEFTSRAFFSGRLDLAAAEGVALAVAATHAGELRAARQLLAGELSRRLAAPMESLAGTLALLESNLDFAEEGIAFIEPDEVLHRVDDAATVLDELSAGSQCVDRPDAVPSFVLVGLPNAGKSTLLNTLVGQTRAVVSPAAGTTRDVLSTTIALRRGTVRLTDIAGLEPAGGDDLSRQMQSRAVRAIETADFVIEVRDGTSAAAAWLPRAVDLRVLTKADLTEVRPHYEEWIRTSAVSGAGLNVLRERLDAIAFGAQAVGNTLALTARHVAEIDAARASLREANAVPNESPELVADSLRRAVDALGRVIGRVTPDDVLGRVFASFCVGK